MKVVEIRGKGTWGYIRERDLSYSGNWRVWSPMNHAGTYMYFNQSRDIVNEHGNA